MTARVAFIALLSFCVAPVALAQTTDSAIGAYDRLPTGEQKIARSLFESQTVSATGPAPMSLDQISAMKGSSTGSGWGNVFKQMQADGLIQARNLGQVVSGHYTAPPPDGTTVVVTGSSPATDSGSTQATRTNGGGKEKVVVTTASGRSMTVGGEAKGNGKATTDTDGVTTASAAGGGNGNGQGNGSVQTASGGNAGKVTTGSGKSAGQSGGVTTASGGGAGAGGDAGGKALGRGK